MGGGGGGAHAPRVPLPPHQCLHLLLYITSKLDFGSISALWYQPLLSRVLQVGCQFSWPESAAFLHCATDSQFTKHCVVLKGVELPHELLFCFIVLSLAVL